MIYTKMKPKREKTLIKRNKSIIGDTIEIMMERLMEGEGVDGIEDRDLVYNDNETGNVNPVTNIRSDKMELMLDEKIGEYEHRRRKMKVETKEKDENIEEANGTDD